LGQALLKDALLCTVQAADIAGIRCLLVYAKDDAARQWYESWEFKPSPTDPYHLFLMLKDLKGHVELKVMSLPQSPTCARRSSHNADGSTPKLADATARPVVSG